jgi:hypothetical protein
VWRRELPGVVTTAPVASAWHVAAAKQPIRVVKVFRNCSLDHSRPILDPIDIGKLLPDLATRLSQALSTRPSSLLRATNDMMQVRI